MKETLLVPKDRVGVINRAVKERLKAELDVQCKIDGNSVELEGSGLNLWTAKMIIKAIARGFSPHRAYRLLEEGSALEVIDLSHLSDKRLKVVRARIIGTKGRTRELIERFTGTYVSVYGKTVSIIGGYEQVSRARKAIEMLISGAKHKTVYSFLQVSA